MFDVKTAGSVIDQFFFIQPAIKGVEVAGRGAGTDAYARLTQTVTPKDGANALRFTHAQFVDEPDLLRLDSISITAVPGLLTGPGMLSFLSLSGEGFRPRMRRRNA